MIRFLDSDPAKAAKDHADQHLAASLVEAACALAYPWHMYHNDAFVVLDDLVPETPWFSRRVVEGARPQAMFPNEDGQMYWLLFGQRVPSPRVGAPDGGTPNDRWCAELGGNYTWLWRHAMELSVEYRRRFGRRHPATQCVWTMEQPPFCLEVTLDQVTEPPPWMLRHLWVEVDGYLDAVASNRRMYNIYRAGLTWTKREPPNWLKEETPPSDGEA